MDRGIVVAGFVIAVGTIGLVCFYFAEKYLDKLFENRGKKQ